MLAGKQNKKKRHLYSRSLESRSRWLLEQSHARAQSITTYSTRAPFISLSLPVRISINVRNAVEPRRSPLIFRHLSQRQAIPGLIYDPGPIKSIGNRCRKSIATSHAATLHANRVYVRAAPCRFT